MMQVMEWTQQMLVIGESFSAAESATLRDALARQSGKFFQAFHSSNMQVCTDRLLLMPAARLNRCCFAAEHLAAASLSQTGHRFVIRPPASAC